MPALKCQNCGSAEIESDSSRADSVCTKCGTVCESGIIVSDVQFEENAHGGSSALGMTLNTDKLFSLISLFSGSFVSSDRKGGASSFGGQFHTTIGRESREVTLKNARKKIVALAQQLRLRPDHIDMAFYFFKLLLAKHLTRGRKSTHTIAACLYITCRTEGTSHMLIDFSDVLQVDVYELGRTYLRLSQALCINIPAMDPCLYVMRFAHKLEFGDKTHDVSMTALRLVSRMKKDWIHFGRRPSGLCGAALLIAARLHEFCRTVTDVIKVVKVHESTLRKRLTEFGETSASQLTVEEFMHVDLDAMTDEMDPPSFKAARKKDRELLDKLKEDELTKEFSELHEIIEKELEERRTKVKGAYAKFSKENSPLDSGSATSGSGSGSDTDSERESEEVAKFIQEDTLNVIGDVLNNKAILDPSQARLDSLLMPPPSLTSPLPSVARNTSNSPRACVTPVPCSPGLGLMDKVGDYMADTIKTREDTKETEEKDEELDLTGIDDEEIDTYLMSPVEIEMKTKLWMTVNEEYLKEQAEKIKKEQELREEMIKNGIDPDKKKKTYKKKSRAYLQSNGTALEAIEKIVQEKKLSSKINYDVLKNLTMGIGSPKKKEESESELSEGSSNDQNVVGIKRPVSPSDTRPIVGEQPAKKSRMTAPRKSNPPSQMPETPTKADPEPEQRSLYDTEPIVESGPIVETGPVEPDEEVENYYHYYIRSL